MNQVAMLRAGGEVRPIIPENIEAVYRLATAIHSSGLAPATMNSPEKVMVAIMTGAELGLPPMQSLQWVAIIKGRPALYGRAVPALLWKNGFQLREWSEGSGDKLVCHCEITRPDGFKDSRSYSVDMAKRAKLWGNTPTWQSNPERMVQMRARGFAVGDIAADVMTGLYLAEEAMDIPDDNKPARPLKSAVELPTVDELPTAETEEAPSEDSASDIAAAIRDAVNAAMVTHLVTEVYGEAIDAMGEEGRAIVEAAREEKMGQLGALV